jgi:asparagine synthase (glutamine-hydrolysing)
VPVGIMLSGGLDSSLITAIAAQVSAQPVNTFTASFPGNKEFNESPYARIVAQHFATRHTELAIEPATVDLLSELAQQFDEPIGDQSIIPTFLVSRLIRGSAKVALVGDGGDEIFGGYPHYSMILRLNRLRSYFSPMVRKIISDMALRFLPVGTRGRNHLIGFDNELSFSIVHINLFLDSLTRKKLLSPLAKRKAFSLISQEQARSSLCRTGLSAVQQMTMMDFQTTMVDDYLVKVDRASMLASLEVRAPFLDHRLVEFGFARVPDDLKVTASERKILLRLLAMRLLPAALDLRRKHGFVMPLANWFKGEWGDFMCDVLEGAEPDLFDKGEIRKLIALQKKGYANTHRLFALTMFELWRRHYRVTL